jgi:hypothetical protein
MYDSNPMESKGKRNKNTTPNKYAKNRIAWFVTYGISNSNYKIMISMTIHTILVISKNMKLQQVYFPGDRVGVYYLSRVLRTVYEISSFVLSSRKTNELFLCERFNLYTKELILTQSKYHLSKKYPFHP